MSSTLKFKKVYIDTKFMSPDSNSTSDFNIELPETMYFDNNSSVFYIDDICIPRSWYTIEKDVNDKLYFAWGTQDGGLTQSYMTTLNPGNYTPQDISTEILASISRAQIIPTYMTCVYNSKRHVLTWGMAAAPGAIAPSLGFYILTPADLKTRLDGRYTLPYDIKRPCDCNEIIGNLEGSMQFTLNTNTFEAGQLNLQPIRNIYMRSSALGNLTNIGPDGSQTVIKKIQVTADYNSFIFDETVLYNDYNSCSGQTLKKLDFQLRTAKSAIIPLHGLNVSFAIVFSRAQPDA